MMEYEHANNPIVVYLKKKKKKKGILAVTSIIKSDNHLTPKALPFFLCFILMSSYTKTQQE